MHVTICGLLKKSTDVSKFEMHTFLKLCYFSTARAKLAVMSIYCGA